MSTADARTPIALRNPLDQLRGAIRGYLLTDAAVTVALVVVLWLSLGVVFDYGTFKLLGFDWATDAPRGVRHGVHLLLLFALLAVFVIGRYAVKRAFANLRPQWLSNALVHEPWPFHMMLATLFAPVFLLMLLVRFIGWYRDGDSDRELALVLEKRFPDVLQDKLLTAIELADVDAAKRAGFSESMIRQTIADAGERVAKLPVSSVFNWDRLRIKAVSLGVITAAVLVGAYVGYKLLGGADRNFAGEFGRVVGVWGERNLLLRNTPWPRSAHLEVLDFARADVRIGKDAPPFKVRTRAYKWVTADSTSEFGWRPLTLQDVQAKLPAAVNAVLSAKGDKALPGVTPSWDVDRIEAAVESVGVADLMSKLNGLVSDSRMGRTIRKIDLPEVVVLNYGGEKTRGKVNLVREANNTFTGDLPNLSESVRFTVRGNDFTTRPRGVTVVPPPQFSKLARTEYLPAYLYHVPPVRPDGSTSFKDLAGLRQTLADKALSLTGDKSVFAIVRGTEFELHGSADKPLKHVLVTPKIGPLPGLKVGSTEPLVLTPTGPDRDTFRFGFRGTDRPVVNTEFELMLVDDDGVTSARSIIVQVTDDAAPQVELAVDVLRKANSGYLVTPVCRVPFMTESKIRDDHGLSKVTFGYKLTQVDAQVTVEAKVPLLAGLFAASPLVPGIGSLLRATAGTQLLQDASDKSIGTVTAGEVPLSRFVEELAKRVPDTATRLQAKLAVPPTEEPKTVKQIQFQNQDLDVFDLRAALPNLLEKDASKVQPRYRIDLALTAADTNVETGPKVGQSLEPIRLSVISEADLLMEMAKDEETQIARLDDVLKKLREAQGKLNVTVSRLRDPAVPPDVLASASVRGVDIAQDLAKARETAAGVLTEYRRLEKEARFNEIPKQQQQYEKIGGKLLVILESGFAASEDSHKAVVVALQEGRRPEDPIVDKDVYDLQTLISMVAGLRAELGESISLAGLRADLERVRQRVKAQTDVLGRMYQESLDRLRLPVIAALPPVEIKVGEMRRLSHPLNWLLFDGTGYAVKLTGPMELKFPIEVRVGDDKNEVEYDVTAGSKPGDYVLKLTPSVGKPVEVVIKVR